MPMSMINVPFEFFKKEITLNNLQDCVIILFHSKNANLKKDSFYNET